jgi:hypothetical protein
LDGADGELDEDPEEEVEEDGLEEPAAGLDSDFPAPPLGLFRL